MDCGEAFDQGKSLGMKQCVKIDSGLVVVDIACNVQKFIQMANAPAKKLNQVLRVQSGFVTNADQAARFAAWDKQCKANYAQCILSSGINPGPPQFVASRPAFSAGDSAMADKAIRFLLRRAGFSQFQTGRVVALQSVTNIYDYKRLFFPQTGVGCQANGPDADVRLLHAHHVLPKCGALTHFHRYEQTYLLKF